MILYYCGEEMIKKLLQLIGLILLVHVVESLKAKKLPAELRIASATIVGCHHCSFVLAQCSKKREDWILTLHSTTVAAEQQAGADAVPLPSLAAGLWRHAPALLGVAL